MKIILFTSAFAIIGGFTMANSNTNNYIEKLENTSIKSDTEIDIEAFVKETKDYKTFELKFPEEAKKLDWSTIQNYEDNDKYVVVISNKEKTKNLFILSNENSFLQDLTKKNENVIINTSLNNLKKSIIKFDENKNILGVFDDKGEKIEKVRCSVGYAGMCAAIGVLAAGNGPGGVFVFGACMLTCD